MKRRTAGNDGQQGLRTDALQEEEEKEEEERGLENPGEMQ